VLYLLARAVAALGRRAARTRGLPVHVEEKAALRPTDTHVAVDAHAVAAAQELAARLPSSRNSISAFSSPVVRVISQSPNYYRADRVPVALDALPRTRYSRRRCRR
jgi:hypothetical protein